MFSIENHFPVVCPCCKATFFFPEGTVIHDPNQLSLPIKEMTPEQVREVHSEVPDEEC